MGGLSNLQKFILSFALESQEQGKNFLRSQEILMEWWGWSPPVEGSIRATVGEADYDTAHSSLSRALSRLWARRLIDIWKNVRVGTGVSLTDAGAEEAHRIKGESRE
jgi:hypothetical protein